MSAEDTPTLGDNSDDEHARALADLRKRFDAFLDGAETWAKREAEKLADDQLAELAPRANDFLEGLRKLFSDGEKGRKAEKDIHLKRAAADVDARWHSITKKIEPLTVAAKRIVEEQLKREKQRREKAAAEAEAERVAAAEAKRKAEAEAAAASSVREKLEAAERAEQAEEAARIAADKAAAATSKPRVASATGAGRSRSLRIKRSAIIASLPAVFNHYRDRPEVAALFVQLAERDLREAPTIRGVKQVPNIPGIQWAESEEL